jgi:hypothetical protein
MSPAQTVNEPMTKNHLQNLHRSLFGTSRNGRTERNPRGHRRMLAMERLESREMLSVTALQTASFSQSALDKPQSKIFQYADQWWTVMPNKTGTWVYRLDGTSWTQTQKISTNSKVHVDVELNGDLAQVLLVGSSNSALTQLATLQYVAADNQFEAWALRPQLTNVGLLKGVETATIEVDSTGRLWVASDTKSTIEVRYSDGVYSTFSNPITIASGIKGDDISSIIAMPNHTIGVLWSNQNTKRFGFRTHVDGADPMQWSADEAPASQSALNIGHGMADDHMHLAVESNGTLYAAVKTGYDKSPYSHISLLVRRPNGTWDDLYFVDTAGTRPVIVVDEAAGQLIMAYSTKEGGGDIVYRTSPLDSISLSDKQVLIPGKVNNVTTAKITSTNQIVFMADGKSAIFTFDTLTPVSNLSISSPTAIVGTTATDLAFADASLLNTTGGSSQTSTNLNQSVGISV